MGKREREKEGERKSQREIGEVERREERQRRGEKGNER